MLRRWLGPETDLVLGEPGAPPVIDVLLAEQRVPWSGITAQHAMPEVYEEIKRATTTLIFVNTRWQAEFAFQELWRLNEDALPIALHHGSLPRPAGAGQPVRDAGMSGRAGGGGGGRARRRPSPRRRHRRAGAAPDGRRLRR